MKIFTYILLAIATVLIIFNITELDTKNFDHRSLIALIGIVASLCAILILMIFTTSKIINKKTNQNYEE